MHNRMSEVMCVLGGGRLLFPDVPNGVTFVQVLFPAETEGEEEWSCDSTHL